MEDPRVQAQNYLESHKVPQLFEAMTAQLLFFKPENPKAYICKYLEQVKAGGTPSLITEQDLDTMFGMFDPTNRGTVTVEQANSALRVILGPSADIAEVGVKAGAVLTKPDFITNVALALKRASPYKLAAA